MKFIQLTHTSGGKITIFIGAGNITVYKGTDNSVVVMDGLHSNGGWKVKETYEEVFNMIRSA